MLIHRIAHPLVTCPDAGRAVGPYNAGSTAGRMDMDEDFTYTLRLVADFLASRLDSSHTPPPVMEGDYIHAGREQSVFVSETQAREWFRAGVEQMQEAGFRWFTYEIQERYVRSTRSQAVALLRRARLVSITDIPFPSDPEYRYCTWCGYNDGCDCFDECDECGNTMNYCCCMPDNCAGCGEQPWSCMC